MSLTHALRDQLVLVTGASGFIGARLVARLRAQGCRLRLVSRRPPASEPGWVRCDLTASAPWAALLEDVTLVIHLAGQTSVREAERDPAADRRINADVMIELLAAARELGTRPTVLFAGTETAAGVHRGRLDDHVIDAPVTHYDAHKLAAERALGEAVAAGWVRGASLRLTTVYGPGPRPQAEDRGIIAMMLSRALTGRALTVYGEGESLRDFLFVDDAVAAFLAAAAVPERLAGDHYIVGSGEGLAIRDAFERIAALVQREVGTHAPVVRVAPPDEINMIDTRSIVADSSRFHALTGWTAQVGFDDGLAHTLAWQLQCMKSTA
jgi:nucleoside-diphosphate-sugar epimerase